MDMILPRKTPFVFIDKLKQELITLFGSNIFPIDENKINLFSYNVNIAGGMMEKPPSFNNEGDVILFYEFFTKQMCLISNLINYLHNSILFTKYRDKKLEEFICLKDNSFEKDLFDENALNKTAPMLLTGEEEYMYIIELKEILLYMEVQNVQVNKMCSSIWLNPLHDFVNKLNLNNDNIVFVSPRMLFFMEIAKLRMIIYLTSKETEETWKECVLSHGDSLPLHCLNDQITKDSPLINLVPNVVDTIENLITLQQKHLLSLLINQTEKPKISVQETSSVPLPSKLSRYNKNTNNSAVLPSQNSNLRMIMETLNEIKSTTIVKPIYLYSAIQLDVCLKSILLKWKCLDYEIGLENTIDDLINRICYFTIYEDTLDILNFNIETIKNKPETLDRNLHTTLFNFETKYYCFIQKLLQWRTKRTIYSFDFSKISNFVSNLTNGGQQLNKVTFTVFTTTFEIETFHQSFVTSLQNYCFDWSRGLSGKEYIEDFKRIYLKSVISDSDHKIFVKLFPNLSATVQNIIEKMQRDSLFLTLKKASLYTPVNVLETKFPDIIKLHDNLVLKIFDSLVSPAKTDKAYSQKSFLTNYYIDEATEDILIGNIIKPHPFLAHVFSRIRFHIQNSPSVAQLFKQLEAYNICSLERTKIKMSHGPTTTIDLLTINTESIYESISLVLIYLKMTKNDSVISELFSNIITKLFKKE